MATRGASGADGTLSVRGAGTASQATEATVRTTSAITTITVEEAAITREVATIKVVLKGRLAATTVGLDLSATVSSSKTESTCLVSPSP